MVDKDNTHFSYKFEGDLIIIDGDIGSVHNDNKLVIRKRVSGDIETVAVFNTWTFWKVID